MAAAIALAREPGPSFVDAISSRAGKSAIDFARARAQHRAYVIALERAGLSVVSLKSEESFPDAPFVEDAAVILPGRAWICSLKAETRRGETQSLLKEIKKYLPVEILVPPAYIDGGDVLNIEGTLYVGLSGRTNREAAEILAKRTRLPVVPVPVLEGLHLKSSVSYLGGNTLAIDPSKVETAAFENFRWIEAEKNENANCLRAGGRILMSSSSPRLAGRIREAGFHTVELDIGEFEKADGGVTCLSLVLPR